MAVVGMGSSSLHHHRLSAQPPESFMGPVWPWCRGDAHFVPVGSAHAEEGALRVTGACGDEVTCAQEPIFSFPMQG